jgi:Gas vesicle synthesis protein GvpO
MPEETQHESAVGSDGNGSDPMGAAKSAARTMVAAAIAGGVAGAAKALVGRRNRTHDEVEVEDDRRAEDEDGHGDDRAQAAPQEGDEERDLPGDRAAADEDDETEPDDEPDEQPQPEPERPAARRREHDAPERGASSSDVSTIVERARSQVEDVLGKQAESISGISRANGSWCVTVEVVEVHRVPDSTDVLASYEVVLDGDGNLVRLERGGRYRRSQVEEER